MIPEAKRTNQEKEQCVPLMFLHAPTLPLLDRVPDSVRLEGTCRDRLLQRIWSKQGEQAVLTWVLSIFKKGNSTVSGQPFPLFDHLYRKLFLIFKQNSLPFHLCHCLWSSHWIPLRRLRVHLLYSLP